ncbi:ABC transporter ATP-binding protein/permease [Candidatus Bealeia paramacronuclearis]|uniref:ABC transporter ATP-binding protein/permease n=1 Tax=Candidatus Bealeia paramacronuclearis TaxID=1921001 RepID=A0ABZ2C5P9_9PROT|nr:ABC transporter ATP-binding protein/permease [Candidatus Bealeia paramacronuclearis]
MQLPHKAVPFLWHYAKLYKWQFLTMLVGLLMWAINECLFPYFVKLMVDLIAASNPGEGSIWAVFAVPIWGIVITWLFMEIAMRTYGFVEVYTFPKFKSSMRGDVFDYVKGQSLNYFSQNLSGSIGSKIADIPRSSQHIMENFYWHVLGIGFAFFITLIVMAQVSLLFSFITLTWCAAHLGITIYYLDEINTKIGNHYQSLVRLNGETVDIIANASVMRLFARIPFETKRLGKYQRTEIEKSKIAGLSLQKVNLIRGALTAVFIFLITYCLLLGWHAQWITPGDFPLVAMSSFNLIGLIWHMSISLVDLFNDLGTLEGALTLLKTEREIADPQDALKLEAHQGEIRYDNVNFRYRKNSPLFQNLSLFIKAGERVGLVGFSGSGKTSFVNLLLREFDINGGQILIDGQNIADATLASLRSNIGVIPQDPSLFHRSIMENIRYGRLDATDEEVIEAAKRAHCHEFIMQLEFGYDTTVGERGLRLSGGQRQRLAIARAILKNAPILVLDEATSALDSATEKKIHDSLEELMVGRTTLVVAHRLSTLKMMDRILVFDKGQIVEEGSQKKLLAAKGRFAHLWELQQEGFLPDKEG